MAVKSLDMIIGLTDRFTAPLRSVISGINKLERATSKTPQAFQKLGTGAIALWGVGKAFNALISPAVDMQSAIDKAGISGVKNLDQMRKEAKAFAGQYATSATDFVNASILINNSIAGITDRALPVMTAKISLMAKATGSSVEESTQYVGQMLKSYSSVAKKMGAIDFVDQISNMASYAKNNLGLSSAQLQAMLEQTSKTSKQKGVGLGDQFATLGVLNKSMGANASGSYDALINSLQGASQKLGISFTNTSGKLLAMPEILEKLQAKFGSNIAGNIEAQKELDNAFGSGAVAMKALLNNSADFNKHLTAISNNKGLSITQKLAEANIKPWDKINAQIANVSESVGRVLLPIFTPLFNTLGSIIGTFSRWLEMFPNIAKWIGIVVSVFMGLAAVAAILSIISGALSLVLSPITLIVLAVVAVVVAIYYLWNNWKKVIGWLVSGWDYLLNLLDNIFIFKPIVASIRLMGSVFSWVFNAIKNNWQSFVNFITDSTAFKVLTAIFDYIKDYFKAVCALFSGDWNAFVNILVNNQIIQGFMKIGKSMANIFKTSVAFIKNIFIDYLNWMIDKVNYIPGINIDLIPKSDYTPTSDIITGTKVNEIEAGGIAKELKESQSKQVDNSRNINGVTVNVQGGLTPEQLQEWNELHNG